MRRAGIRNGGHHINPANNTASEKEPEMAHVMVGPGGYRNLDGVHKRDARATGGGVYGSSKVYALGEKDSKSNTKPYWISETSVVNKEMLWTTKVTAARVIWFLNAVCFLVHLGFAIWTLTFNKTDGTMDITIYRVKGRWVDLTGDGYEFEVIRNTMPINFCLLTASFFILSAAFHLLACAMGIFESTWIFYFRQIDQARCYWRWKEYSASASVMAMALAISIGIREQNALALIFLCHVACMWMGWTCEVYSRPVTRPKTVKYKPTIEESYSFPLVIDQAAWEGDKVATSSTSDTKVDNFWPNYFFRMYPHVLGYFPMTGAWVVIVAYYRLVIYDLSVERDDVTIPEWVDGALWGTILIFWSFSFVQAIFQYLPPGFYWGSEVLYCILSLSAKVYLGLFLLLNVITLDGSVESNLASGGRVGDVVVGDLASGS